MNKEAWHKKRLRREARFRCYGLAALIVAVFMLFLLIGSLVQSGASGFIKYQVRIPVTFNKSDIGLKEDEKIDELTPSRYMPLVRFALKNIFVDVNTKDDLKDLYALLANNASLELKKMVDADNSLFDKEVKKEIWLPLSSSADLFFKGGISENTPEGDRNLNDNQIRWLKALNEDKVIRKVFNSGFFSKGDSRNPESAGFLGAMVGSFFTLIICLLVVFPFGVATAVFLEEFAKKNRLVDFIEININNLAAVPSIVFGLLGLVIYINTMGLPRSASLVGGMTLALMILPVIIITTRTSLKAIPGSIRDAARALGATPIQMVWHHTLPLAMPGIMTGTILGMARAIGETAPLLMIGMVAFIADIPSGFTSPATVMPVQIYLWAGSPEAGFAEKTAAGILVLLVLLIAMNMLAIILRKKFEVRW
ncbi:MAG: phosphate ABC transporter permease PstA [Pseudomonadota bacterium]